MSSWPMKPSSGSADWELPPSGNLLAVCVALIDLGTQQDSFQGTPREARQLAIAWELIGQVNTKTGRPHVVCSKFNASLHPKANFRKTLESWRGVPIKEDEEFDIFKIVGAPCLLQISHDTTNGGKEIYRIDAVTGLVKGMQKPAPTYPLIKFKIDEGPAAIPAQEWLPHLYGQKINAVVGACIEFRGRSDSTHSQQAPPQQNNTPAPLAPPPDSGPDIPFSWLIGMVATALAAFGMVA